MRQKAKADTEAVLDKTTNITTHVKPSTLPHSRDTANFIKSPPEPSANVARVSPLIVFF